MKKQAITINQLFNLLKTNYSIDSTVWWPFESVYEMVIGAILVQNTSWINVEKSLERLRDQTGFDPKIIRQLPQEDLIQIIHSSGFQQNKSRNIKELFDWLELFNDDFDNIKNYYGEELRDELLKKRGIGPETADVILLYAFNQPHFIADTYARRLFEKLNAPVDSTYSAVKEFAEKNGQLSLEEWGAFHGWIIQFAQAHLKPRQPWKTNFLVPYHLVGNEEKA